MPIKIFIGNLSSDTTNEDLRPLFDKYGEVTECDVLRNFGFVHMQNEGEAERAINELAGTLVRGQRINVEKSTGSTKGGGRGGGGGGGGKMMGRGAFRGGRGGGGRGRGAPYGGARDYDPYPPPRGRPYERDPYDYYDRHYSQERPPPRLPPPPYGDERRPYEREERLPPPRDPYDRYPPPRYPPPERYPYERLPPRPADPYERPPPDYYRAYDGYDDPVGRPPHREDPVGPPGITRGRDAANGFDDRRPEVRPGGGDSYSSSYSSYYDRFYSKPPANGDRIPTIPSAARPGMPPPPGGRMPPQSRPIPSQSSNDQQSKLQTGPIYF